MKKFFLRNQTSILKNLMIYYYMLKKIYQTAAFGLKFMVKSIP